MKFADRYLPKSVPEIAAFEIKLDSPTLYLETVSSAPGTINGRVVLSLISDLHNVRAIDLRFVGGVVSRFDPPDSSLNLRGSQQLFDQKLVLLECDAAHVFEPRSYSFDFCIQVPNEMPSSIQSRDLKVQYLLVAALSFKNGCYGMIPILAQEPIVQKCEIQVVRLFMYRDIVENIPSQLPTTITNDPDAQKNAMLMLYRVENAELIANEPVVIWTPCDQFFATIYVLSAMDQPLSLGISFKESATIQSLRWSFIQSIKYTFIFDLHPTKQNVRDLAVKDKSHESNAVHSHGVFEDFQEFMQMNQEGSPEYERVLCLDLERNDIMPDIQTKSVVVRHTLKLSVEIDSKLYETGIPIQMVPESPRKQEDGHQMPERHAAPAAEKKYVEERLPNNIITGGISENTFVETGEIYVTEGLRKRRPHRQTN